MSTLTGLLLVGCAIPAALLSIVLTLSARKGAEVAVAGAALTVSVAMLATGVALLS